MFVEVCVLLECSACVAGIRNLIVQSKSITLVSKCVYKLPACKIVISIILYGLLLISFFFCIL
jgi:hypothetical protein